jgi:hypothetical protein
MMWQPGQGLKEIKEASQYEPDPRSSDRTLSRGRVEGEERGGERMEDKKA